MAWLIHTHETLSDQLMEKLQHINTAETTVDIKKYLTYAYHYANIQSDFGNMYKFKYTLQTFIDNHDNPLLTTYLYKSTITTRLILYKSVYNVYSSFKIDTPFYDMVFNDFDPLVFRKIVQNHELKKSHRERSEKEKYKNPYGTMYGIALLSGLTSQPLLRDFVIQCTKRIIHIAKLAKKQKSAKMYSFFLKRYTEYHSGGSDNTTDSTLIPTKDDYIEMADECMQFLTDSTNMDVYSMQRLKIRESNSISTPIVKIVHELLQYISIEQNIKIPAYIEYLQKIPINKRSDIQNQVIQKHKFLKRYNTLRINNIPRFIKVRTRRRRNLRT